VKKYIVRRGVKIHEIIFHAILKREQKFPGDLRIFDRG